MEYTDFLEAHARYGTSESDIKKRKGYDNILENVVIAPWWSHSMFESENTKIEQISDKIYNITIDGVSFSFIELRAIGAPTTMDSTLALGVTNCKRVLFIGSAGALSISLKIGQLVIPSYSICGDGASRYLNADLKDEFGVHETSFGSLTDSLRKSIKKITGEDVVSVPNYSLDTIFAQFPHIDYIKSLGAATIEMETAAFFKSCHVLKLNCAVLFCISDSTVENKSLYSGRSKEENDYRHYVRDKIIPRVIVDLFKGESNEE